jgi:hypothetical protein
MALMLWVFSGDWTRRKVGSVRSVLCRVPFWITVLTVFGTGVSGAATIFPTNSVWKYSKGLSEASSPDPTVWRTVVFDDSSWASGPAPFYYNEPLSGTLLGDMQNSYRCVFLRRAFAVSNAYEFGALTLSARCDDGYIAWINGVEVARYNMPAGFVPFDGLANVSVPEPVPYIATNIFNPSSFLVAGSNVIAVQLFNFAIDSGDIQFNATLAAFPDTNAPVIAALEPPGGSAVRKLRSIQVAFSEPVTNVDAADLRVNGAAATNVAALSPLQFRFEFPQPPTGAVSVAFAAGHGIRDLSPAANSFTGATWNYVLDPNAPPPPVRINEFMAANASTILDEDGDPSDWIELQNFGAQPVSLAGWLLTDDASVPGKWRFPAVALGAGQFKLIWASAKNRTNAAAPLHTNFKLDRGGGYLALFDADTNLVSAFAAYPSQFTDVSYGRAPSSNSLGYFAVPTPGAGNAAQFSGRADAPGFSHKRGFYDTNFSLVLTSETAGATIYFTTNGTPPSPTNGVAYISPLTMTNTTVIRAAAFAPGLLPSDAHTHSFLFTRDIIRQPDGVPPPGWPASWGNNVVDYGMDPNVVTNPLYAGTIENDLRAMPSLCLVMDLRDLFDPGFGIYANAINDGIDWERPASLELIYADGADGFQEGAGLRIRGGFSRSSGDPKHSFRLFFREEYGAGKLDFPMFGPTGASSFDKFDLRCTQDASWAYLGDANGTFLPDTFARDTQLALGRPATRGNSYHLYINGVYWGVYNTEERPEANFAASYFGGAPEEYDVVRIEYGPFDVVAADGDLGAWRRLWQAATNGFANDADYERVQGNNPDGTSNPAYEVLVDMDNLIDYMLLTIYVGNFDGPVYQNNFPNNFFASRNRNTREGFRFFTHDAELSLSDVNFDRTQLITVGDPAAGSTFSESNPQYFWQRLWANAEFRMRAADHVQKHFFNGGALTPAACLARYAARTNEMSRGMVGESARWGDAQREPPIVRENWINAVSSVINGYFPNRTAVVLQQLRNRGLYPNLAAPNLSHPGGAVPAAYPLTLSHTNASGTIWFTLDGSDPRLRGGAVSASAQSYSGAIIINTPTVVRARVRDGTTWSAIMEATYYPPQDLSGLRITEIMYNPPRLGSVDGDEFEFIEFKNTGNTIIDLTGISFTAGIGFTFTNGTKLGPGAFFLLARNLAQFGTKYPGVPVNGIYSGRLDNAGETLRVSTALLSTVLNVTFDDVTPWPLAADGFDFSLVPSGALPGADSEPLHWRASTNPGGSPGTDDPPSAIARVVVNEVLSRPAPSGLDAVELFNPTSNAVDVAGWFLTDDPAVPKKFRFATNAVIPANGFLVLAETWFNPTPGTNGSFSFGLRGDDVFLFSGDVNTNLTGYSHGFTFGGSEEGVSFGRHINSAGEEQFVRQLAPTFGGSNSGARFGPVVINEIHYHPAPEHDEFIELKNLGVSPVNLFEAANPTNAWRLNGAGFTFPTNVTLAPNSFALVTALAPAAFRVKYSVPATVPIFGPLAGVLQDSGERLELQRPEIPDTNGVVWIMVDAVRFNDKPPWPAGADGDGPSLQRLDSASYGDDPANWFASGITPGAANAFNQSPNVALVAPLNGAQVLAPTNLALMANATDADGAVTRVEFFNSGVKLGEAVNAPFSFIWSNAPVGTHTLSAKARDNRLAVTESTPITVNVRQPVLANLTFISAGVSWRYHDKGQNLGTNWIALTYNDSGWSNGPAQLGYGDADEATIVGYGPNASSKYITTYFRRAFVNSSPVPFTALLLRVIRDDGIVVWLNGREIFRDNMPGGAIAYNTLASSSLSPPLENTFIQTNLSPALIAPGTNILAVEIHQGVIDSSDISFDLELTGTLIQPEPQIGLRVLAGSSELRWPALAGTFRPEQTTNLAPPAIWSPVTNAAVNDGYWNSLVLTNGVTGQRFFRLNRF